MANLGPIPLIYGQKKGILLDFPGCRHEGVEGFIHQKFRGPPSKKYQLFYCYGKWDFTFQNSICTEDKNKLFFFISKNYNDPSWVIVRKRVFSKQQKINFQKFRIIYRCCHRDDNLKVPGIKIFVDIWQL